MSSIKKVGKVTIDKYGITMDGFDFSDQRMSQAERIQLVMKWVFGKVGSVQNLCDAKLKERNSGLDRTPFLFSEARISSKEIFVWLRNSLKPIGNDEYLMPDNTAFSRNDANKLLNGELTGHAQDLVLDYIDTAVYVVDDFIERMIEQ